MKQSQGKMVLKLDVQQETKLHLKHYQQWYPIILENRCDIASKFYYKLLMRQQKYILPL